MKKLVFALLTIALTTATFAQDNPRPTKSRFWKSKHSTFNVKPGDILVYSVDNNGERTELIVHVKKYGNTISYDYYTAKNNARKNVTIPANAVNNAVNYSNIFTQANNTGGNKSSIWLSKKSFRDIATVGATSMDFGNGPQEYTKGNNGTLNISYKGKPKILTVYNIVSGDGSVKNIGVMSDEQNPLIVTMTGAVKMTLKEVR